MTLDQVRIELSKPEISKYKRYLNSFWNLTPDEQDSVEKKHSGLAEYLRLFRIEMDLMVKILQGALSVGPEYGTSSGLGLALQVEDLDQTLKMVTFDEKHLKLDRLNKDS